MIKINVELEMRALDAELSGMKTTNREREKNGYSLAYYEESFREIADKFRALKTEEKTK
jgi:hypothetical protein